MSAEDTQEPQPDLPANTKSSKAKPLKVLPTDRVGFEKQLAVLRGYAAASGPDKRPVSNSDVASIVGIHAGSVSNCNPFFADCGLVVREAGVYRPADEVFEYANSYNWDAGGAAEKLAPVLSATWFADTLFPKLAFRALTKDEAIKFLAEEAKATPNYRDQLSMLLEYLAAAGLVIVEGNLVSKKAGAKMAHPPSEPTKPVEKHDIPKDDPTTTTFEIPIPDKRSAKIILPKNLDSDDWTMIQAMLAAYVSRMIGQNPKNASKYSDNS
jgi:hypothetical protein